MAVSPTYPGVYIEEVSSGVHTIIGVSTSITAFLGRTAQGPTNAARTLTSFADFERTFGELDPAYPLAYAVFDFFAAGGSQAVVVRLFGDAGVAAAKAVSDAAAASSDLDPLKVAKAARDKVADFPNPPASKAADDVAKAAEAASTAAGATSQKVKDAASAKAATVTDTSTAMVSDATNTVFKLAAAGAGAWANRLWATVDTIGITDEVATQVGVDKALLFNVSIFNNRNKLPVDQLATRPPDERIQNVSVWESAGSRRIDRVLKQASNLTTFAGALKATKDDAKFDNVKVGFENGGKPKLVQFTGGVDSMPLTTPDVYIGNETDKTGMHALDDVDLINLLCLPPDVRGGGPDDVLKAVNNVALKYCVARRAVLIVDPPTTWKNRASLISSPQDHLSNDINLTGPEARNAFLYYPRVQMPDLKRGGQIDTFAACGLIAGIFARTDAQRGVWVAPAGLDASLGGVTLEVNLTDRENGILNPLGINCLRAFPVAGRVVWGTRTLRGADQLADEYKYLPVRRTALFIEESLYRGTQWVVFQPNDEPLWGQIRLNVGAFMNDLFRKGAFQGSRPQDAYFVRCDKSTTTQNDIDRGVVNILVGFAPLKPAEFVVVQVQQIAGQIQV